MFKVDISLDTGSGQGSAVGDRHRTPAAIGRAGRPLRHTYIHYREAALRQHRPLSSEGSWDTYIHTYITYIQYIHSNNFTHVGQASIPLRYKAKRTIRKIW